MGVVTKGLKIRVKTHFVRMASLQRISSARKVFQNPGAVVRMMSNDTGRSEGAVREAGGAFGKKEKAQEDQFFRQQQQAQLKKLKNSHTDEIQAHESEIKRHQEAIQRHKEKISELEK